MTIKAFPEPHPVWGPYTPFDAPSLRGRLPNGSMIGG